MVDIEHLLEYIIQKGYQVNIWPRSEVLPGRLCIYTHVDSLLVMVSVVFTPQELRSAPFEVLTHVIDRKIELLEASIKKGPPPSTDAQEYNEPA